MKFHLMNGKGQWFNTSGGWSDHELHAVVFGPSDRTWIRFGHGEYFSPLPDAPNPVRAVAGYMFWQDRDGLWNVTPESEKTPPRCAYRYAKSIADLKGIRLPD